MRVEANMISTSVEVDINLGDLFSALTEKLNEEDMNGFKCALSNLAYTLKNIPDEVINQFSTEQRQRIYEKLSDQIKRWQPNADSEKAVVHG